MSLLKLESSFSTRLLLLLLLRRRRLTTISATMINAIRVMARTKAMISPTAKPLADFESILEGVSETTTLLSDDDDDEDDDTISPDVSFTPAVSVVGVVEEVVVPTAAITASSGDNIMGSVVFMFSTND